MARTGTSRFVRIHEGAASYLYPVIDRWVIGMSAACVGLACSEPESSEPADCDALCANETVALSVGRFDGAELAPLSGEQRMEYGRQGGQHFYVDAQLSAAVSGRVRLRVEFVDAAGSVVGVGRAQVEADGCGARFTEVPVVVEEDERQSGRLRVTAELLSCAWSAQVRQVNVVPPLEGPAKPDDAGSVAAPGDAG